MAYGSATNAYVLAGLSSTQISWGNMQTLVTMADNQVDAEAEASLSSAQKSLASDYLSASFALSHMSGDLSVNNLIEIAGAVKLDTRTSASVRNVLSRQFFERYQYVISQAPKDGFIVRVP